ncbi:MAG: class I SAM-dependent methyltransferase [Thermoplasmata archaeon]
MTSAESRVALRHPLLILEHPQWWISYLIGGKEGVMRKLVQEDLATVRSQPPLTNLTDLVSRPPASVLGRVGAPQEYLYYLTRWLKPETVVETGVDRGLSSAFLLAGLHDNRRGHLYSIDLPSARYYDPTTGTTAVSNVGDTTAPGFVIPPDLRTAWTLTIGDSRTALPELLGRLGGIDMFLHDSEHTYELMRQEYILALAHLRPGGLLVSDDVNWNRAFKDTAEGREFDFSTVLLERLGVAWVRPDHAPGGSL